MDISFTKGAWEEHFQYACSWRFPNTPKFLQEPDCIVNANKSEFTTALLKDRYPEGTRISFTASFESYGAPLLMIAGDLDREGDGNLRFGNYQEIVLWEKGVNVWDFQKTEEPDSDFTWGRSYPFVEKGVRIQWLARVDFPLEAGKRHRLTVELCKKRLKVWADANYFELAVPSLPEEAWLGITGCEGINRFYDLQISLPQQKEKQN